MKHITKLVLLISSFFFTTNSIQANPLKNLSDEQIERIVFKTAGVMLMANAAYTHYQVIQFKKEWEKLRKESPFVAIFLFPIVYAPGVLIGEVMAATQAGIGLVFAAGIS